MTVPSFRAKKPPPAGNIVRAGILRLSALSERTGFDVSFGEVLEGEPVALPEDSCEVSCRSTCAATILRLAAFCGACGNIRRVGLEYLQQLPAATSPRMITSEPATATEAFHVAREV